MGAGRQQQACTECTKKCFKIHRKKNPNLLSSPPQSFFKIMIGNFHDVLFIPPKFARMLEILVNQSTYLEDSNGHRWKVEVSILDDSLAFHQGWREFVFDHSVSIGEFVVFRYINEAHFVVQIFGVSGCERFNFPEKDDCNGQKRKRKVKECMTDSTNLHKNCEDDTSNVQVCAIGEEPGKRERVGQTSNRGSSGPKLTESKYAPEGMDEDPCAPKKSSHYDKSSGKLKPESIMHSKTPSSMIIEDPLNEPEGNRNASMKMHTNGEDCIIIPQVNSSCCSNSSAETLTTSQMGHNKEEIDYLITSPKEDLIREQVCTLDCSEEPCSMNKRDTVTGQVAKEICPIGSIAPEITQTKLCIKDTENVMKTKGEPYYHNKFGGSQRAFREELKKNQNDISVTSDSVAISTAPNSEEGLPTPDCSKVPLNISDKMSASKHGALRSHVIDLGNCDSEGKYFPEERNEVIVAIEKSSHSSNRHTKDQCLPAIECSGEVHELRLTEEGIPNIFCEDLMSELGSLEITPTNHCGFKKDDGNFEVGKTAIRENCSHYDRSKDPCTAFTFDCTEENFNTISMGDANCKGPGPHIEEGQFGFLGNNLVPLIIKEENAPCGGNSPKIMNKVPESHESPKLVDDNPLQADIELDAVSEENEIVNHCLDKNSWKAVKSEAMDSVGLTSPSSSDFFFSKTVDTQFWLELEESLPSKVGKRRHDRIVVLLRDPGMRVWPVVYIDSIKFVGFLGGWEDFATSNNLRKGDTCNFELVDLSDSMLQVQISRVVEATF